MRHTALILLAALMLVSLAEGHRCIHDELFEEAYAKSPIHQTKYFYQNEADRPPNENLDTGLDPAKGYQPIRIIPVYHNIQFNAIPVGGPNYCYRPLQTAPNFRGDMLSCDSVYDVLTEKKWDALEMLIQHAIDFLSHRLLVQPLQLPIQSTGFSSGVCQHFMMPDIYWKAGAGPGDFFIHVGAGPMGEEEKDTKVWGLTCAELYGRPVVGVLNVNPRHISDDRQMIRLVAHQMLHALGFHKEMFERKDMITSVNKIRGKTEVPVVNSAAVLDSARNHYACPNAPGMELEDQQEGFPIGSHWKRRNAKDDIMAGISGGDFITPMTIAAMEDTGLYKGNYANSEIMAWGREIGCGFLADKCVDRGIPQDEFMFCTNDDETRKFCTSDRLAVGYCRIGDLKVNEPQFLYFPRGYIGSPSNDLMDYCPHVQLSDWWYTCFGGERYYIPGSLRSGYSRCLDAPSGLKVKRYGSGNYAICARVDCDPLTRTYTVLFRDAKKPTPCPVGQIVHPSKHSSVFGSGYVVCPIYDEVCHAGDAGVGIEDSSSPIGYTVAVLTGCVFFLLTVLLN